LILEPLASSLSVLSEQDKEAGVCLVDIGGGTTDIAIFYDNIIRHTAVIPLGGNIITSDIKEGCMVLHHQAELLKTKFGKAITEEANPNEIVSIPGLRNRQPKEISIKNLGSYHSGKDGRDCRICAKRIGSKWAL
jgi:cell division protein FtsA